MRNDRALVVRENPALPLPKLSLTDLVLLAGIGWLAMSDQGKALLGEIFPGSPGANYPVGTGTHTGEDPYNPGTAVVPQQAQFRLVNVSWTGGLLHYGATVTVQWQVSHIGPAGVYVCGLEFAPAHPLCMLGSHNGAFQTIEGTVQCGNDAVWTPYTVGASAPFQGGVMICDVRGFVRDARGNQITDGWTCGGLGAV